MVRVLIRPDLWVRAFDVGRGYFWIIDACPARSGFRRSDVVSGTVLPDGNAVAKGVFMRVIKVGKRSRKS